MTFNLTLKQITYEAFNAHCRQEGLREIESPSVIIAQNIPVSRGFAQITETPSYSSVDNLLADMPEGNDLILVWAKSRCGVGEAQRRTQNERDAYFYELSESQGKYSEMGVRLSKGGKNKRKRDFLTFQKIDRQWLLTQIQIEEKNVDFYDLQGNINFSDRKYGPVLHGVYSHFSSY